MPKAYESVIKLKHEDLCSQLDVDRGAIVRSWESFITIQKNCTLEGEPLHWLSCALYVACRTSITPTVQSGKALEGNCVSLTRLLRLCNISVIQFFNKIKKWMEMTSMTTEFRFRIESLERKFAVSTLLFQKFKPLFQEIFIGLAMESVKTNSKGTKKQKLIPCTTNALFEFTWCLYICVKGEFHNSADNLVDMFHILLSCLDYVFENAFMSKRFDLFNNSFKGLPEGYNSDNYELPSKAPCIITVLCEMKEALPVEARTTKEYSWRPVIENFFEKKILKGDNASLTGILEVGNFDANLKSLNNLYETYVLSVGEFDERIFLGEHANNYIGTPNKVSGEEITKTIDTFSVSGRAAAPMTPLSGRRYVRARQEPLTPVSEATNSVARLRAYLAACRPSPSAHLMQLFADSGVEEEAINNNVIGPCNRWMEQLSASLQETRCSLETITNRCSMVTSLHYKVLEHILREEKRKKPQVSLQTLLSQEIFQLTLYACCAEVVLHAYGVYSMCFPQVLKIFDLSAFHFYKIIELVVQAVMDKLSREVIKHLNAVEEQALEWVVWTSSSPLWARLQGGVPASSDVYPHECPPSPSPYASPSPSAHAAIAAHQRRLAAGMMSPVSTATDRFTTMTPLVEQAKKQLFKDTIKPGQSLLVKEQGPTTSTTNGVTPTSSGEATTPKKNGKSDSLVLFFRKFYSLAVVRMSDLFTRLRLTDQELKRKIWTCLEHSIMHQTQLMRDRHLDQILMCAVYIICKVSHNSSNQVERTFTDIMRCYRQQPQADNHVYRSVLIGCENKDERGDLIKFYNKVYVQCMQSFALKFTGRHRDECSLSPLPAARGEAARSPPGGQRVSERHHLFVKPLTSPPAAAPAHHLSYRFSRSPAKDLHAINTMLSCDMSLKRAGGGEADAVVGEGDSAAGKRAKYPPAPGVARKLQGLMTDRQAV